MRKYLIFLIFIIFFAIISLCIWSIRYSKNEEKNIENKTSCIEIEEYKMTENEIKDLPSCNIKCQTQEQENTVGEDQICDYKQDAKNFSYNGDITKVKLGDYIGLTYYSQIDDRWASYPYTSTGNTSQTIGSSGCGPTCAAMVVTAIKGVITPPEMGDLFVKYGYRSANNGTYLSAFSWVADSFGIEYKETYSLDEAIRLLKNNYYVIASCGNGLFTTGGHLILIVGIDEDTLKIYDPYLYSGKFDTASRKGKVTVEGNTVYCSIDNFRNYANYTRFFAFKHGDNVPDNNSKPVITGTIMYVNTPKGLNVRNAPNGDIVGALTNKTQVIVYEINGEWAKIGDNRWVSLKYLTETIDSNDTTINNNNSSGSGDGDKDITSSDDKNYTTGRYKILANVLNVRTGPSLNYRIKMYYQLTNNARIQNAKLGYGRTNGYRRGVVCDVTRVKGEWGLTPSGWICLRYCKKI